MSAEKARWVIGVVCLLLAGCGSTAGGGTESVTNKPTAGQVSPTIIAATSTRTPRPTATSKPTSTPYPEASLPDTPLSPDGPWLIFMAATEERGPRTLWAINSHGTGLTQLVDEPVMTFRVQPVESLENGVSIAYVTQPQSENDIKGMALKTITLPGGEIRTISALLYEADITMMLDVYTVESALRTGGLAWSPDGSKLAFVSALGGKSVDIYTYDIQNRAIIRLTYGPYHAYALRWSQDGDHIVHEGFDYVGMNGPVPTGLWAAQSNGGGVVFLNKEIEYATDVSVSWLSPTEVLIANRCLDLCESDIRRANIETGDTQTILKEPFIDIAYSQKHDTWLLLRSASSGPDMSLILIRNGARTEIPSQGISQVWWDESQDQFTGQTDEDERYAISLRGELTRVLVPSTLARGLWIMFSSEGPYPSPDKALQAWHLYKLYNHTVLPWERLPNHSELWIGEPMKMPELILSADAPFIRDIIWSPGSRRLLMLTNQGLWMAERPGFEPVRIADRPYTEGWLSWEGQWTPETLTKEEKHDE